MRGRSSKKPCNFPVFSYLKGNAAKGLFHRSNSFFNCYGYYRDASWETEPNAFEDLTKVYSTCDAEPCLCPNGKDFSVEGEGEYVVIYASS